MSKKHTLIKQGQIVNEGGIIEADVRIKCNELQLSEARNPIHSINQEPLVTMILFLLSRTSIKMREVSFTKIRDTHEGQGTTPK